MSVQVERFPYRAPFRISGHEFTATELVVVELRDQEGATGRGEAAGVYYTGDGASQICAWLESVREEVEVGADRAALQHLLPPGGARNALDCAMWDLEAQRTGSPVWELAGVPPPRPRETTFTLSAEQPTVMAAAARSLIDATALKLKLTGDLHLDRARVQAVRTARADCWLAVDANQGYGRDTLPALVETLTECAVVLLEQPVRRGEEAQLDGFDRALPFAADESCLGLNELDSLVGRFDIVNIKLDKCGGLTEALAIAARARTLGLGVMVGNMMGTSLSMAPSFVVGQLCDYVDLDGPIFLAQDREPGVRYTGGSVDCPPALWGSGTKRAVTTRNS